MIRVPLHSRVVRSMVVVLAACVVLDGVALYRALRIEPLDAPGAEARDRVATILPRIGRDTTAQADDTLPDDPFDPDRGGVVTQAGEVAPAAPVAAPVAAPEQVVALVGTVVRPDGGGIAVCQVGNQPPRVLRVGERIGGLTLLEVGQGRAAFRNQTGATVSLRLATPGA